ncbi:dihydrolipoyl dehydrogenase [candidate division KSB1 bacterium]|nr:dihydrolipoyl dehydrogenase [candidate division KSB1 bacterium]RQW01257.1 MAG: dihydrolipoyl dehydrogenase [candidate division KSB1 bacterium]
MSNKISLVVIGAGPGGYAAAFYAADLGMQVTLVDPEENPGGVCLYRGCIPSKALLHVAKLIYESREAKNWGLEFAEPKIDLDTLRAFKGSVVKKLTGGTGQLAKQRKINHIRGKAVFKNNTTLEITSVDGSKSELEFDSAIIATGSRPTIIPNLWIDSPRLMDSTGALELTDIPERLLVIGGGYIGLEMGTVYAALGSAITVVEMMPNILPGADKDLVRVLQKSLETKFKSIQTETRVIKLEEVKEGIKATLENKNGEKSQELFDKVLMTIGRRPNSEHLGLENTQVRVNQKGFIEIDGARRTAEPAIYAIGDVAGEPMLAHKASHEGHVAVDAIAGERAVFEPAAIPAVVFTDPEVAWAGLTENEAQAQDIKVEVLRFPWAASGRALTMNRTDGMTKLLFEPETQRILGIGLVGSGAGELVSEGALAIEMAANAMDLKLTIHPHPTLSETVMETAEMLFGTCTHVYRPKRAK